MDPQVDVGYHKKMYSFCRNSVQNLSVFVHWYPSMCLSIVKKSINSPFFRGSSRDDPDEWVFLQAVTVIVFGTNVTIDN